MYEMHTAETQTLLKFTTKDQFQVDSLLCYISLLYLPYVPLLRLVVHTHQHELCPHTPLQSK